MKMKEICELTGLTDRAVRYYIENGLVFPETGEYYTGRRSFAFSHEDVVRLRRIALLRKARFGIEQIRELFAGADVRGIVGDRIEVLSKDQEDSMKILKSLQDAKLIDGLTIEKLTHILETPVSTADIPQKDSDPPFTRLLRNARRMIAGLCIGVCAMMLVFGLLFFGVFDGAEFIGRRLSFGETLITVVVDGEMLSSDKFDLKELIDDPKVIDKDTAYSYGCVFDSWYGYTGGTLVMEDDTEIDFGFLNDNNWHNPHIEIEVITGDDTITVRQTVAYRSDDDIITAAIKETTEPAEAKQISVFMEGLIG